MEPKDTSVKTAVYQEYLNTNQDIQKNKKEEIIRAYMERGSMRGVSRIYGLSTNTLANWIKKKAEKLPDILTNYISPALAGDILELDEL